MAIRERSPISAEKSAVLAAETAGSNACYRRSQN